MEFVYYNLPLGDLYGGFSQAIDFAKENDCAVRVKANGIELNIQPSSYEGDIMEIYLMRLFLTYKGLEEEFKERYAR